MRIKLHFSFLALFIVFSTSLSSQTSTNKQFPFLPGNAYTVEKQTWDCSQLLQEVGIPLAPNDFNLYQEQLDRVYIVKTNASLVESYTNLSQVKLKDKYNPTLRNDYSDFKIESFNPLKYFFNFYSPSQMNYRIDNSDYMVIIVPFQNK